MSALVETAIWLALKSRIETLPIAYKKAYPGEAFEVPHEAKLAPFLSVGRISASPVRVSIGDGKPHNRTGFVVISLFYPLGRDLSAYDQIAAEIADHFVDGTQMTYSDITVTITSYPHIQDGYEDNGYWIVPVRIPWRCYA